MKIRPEFLDYYEVRSPGDSGWVESSSTSSREAAKDHAIGRVGLLEPGDMATVKVDVRHKYDGRVKSYYIVHRVSCRVVRYEQGFEEA